MSPILFPTEALRPLLESYTLPAPPEQTGSTRSYRFDLLSLTGMVKNIDTIAAYRCFFPDPAHGCGWVRTPNLDRLAGSGLNFLEGYSPSPVCSPARGCIWTGRTTTENGVVHNALGISQATPNLGQWLSEHSNYQNFYCGKWHASGSATYATVSGRFSIPGFQVLPIGGVPTGDYNDFNVSTTTAAFLRDYQQPDPFLFVAGLMNPHDICYWIPGIGGQMINRRLHVDGIDPSELPPVPPNVKQIFNYYHPEQPVLEWDETAWRHYAYDYYRMVERVDADVGRILDALDERDDETLIIFTSDHGEGLGRHSRVQKWHPFEQSAKVPFILAGAGVRQRGEFDNAHLVNLLDIFATVCDTAGIAPPEQTRGRSLMPLARGDQVDDWPESTYYDFQVTGRVLRTARYKYVKYYERVPSRNNGRWFVDADGNPAPYDPVAIRNYRVHPQRMLFDLIEDPWEMRNLADESAFAGIMQDHGNLLYDQWERYLEPNKPNTIS